MVQQMVRLARSHLCHPHDRQMCQLSKHVLLHRNGQHRFVDVHCLRSDSTTHNLQFYFYWTIFLLSHCKNELKKKRTHKKCSRTNFKHCTSSLVAYGHHRLATHTHILNIQTHNANIRTQAAEHDQHGHTTTSTQSWNQFSIGSQQHQHCFKPERSIARCSANHIQSLWWWWWWFGRRSSRSGQKKINLYFSIFILFISNSDLDWFLEQHRREFINGIGIININ